MTVEIRLFATLRKYLPSGGDRASAPIEMPAGSSIADVLEELGIPVAMASLVLVNGHYESNKRRQLEDDCVLSVRPPIAGG